MKVAVWGIGSHALKNILPALATTPDLSLKGICSRDPEKVARVSRDFKCVGWTDPKVMLDDPEVDAIYLSTPTRLHFENGVSVLAAKKHLWCEKPLATDLVQVLELVRRAKESRLVIAEGFMYLYHPQFARLMALTEAHLIGNIRSLTCRFGLPQLAIPGFRDPAEMKGGTFWDVGCYPLSVVSTLFPGENLEVLASQIILDKNNQIDQSGFASIRLRKGPLISLEWGLNCSYKNEIEIWGEKGSVSTDRIFSKPADFRPQFRLRDLTGVEMIEISEPGNHFVAMLRHFRNLAVDAKAAESEREKIISRARFRDEIWNFGKLPRAH